MSFLKKIFNITLTTLILTTQTQAMWVEKELSSTKNHTTEQCISQLYWLDRSTGTCERTPLVSITSITPLISNKQSFSIILAIDNSLCGLINISTKNSTGCLRALTIEDSRFKKQKLASYLLAKAQSIVMHHPAFSSVQTIDGLATPLNNNGLKLDQLTTLYKKFGGVICNKSHNSATMKWYRPQSKSQSKL